MVSISRRGFMAGAAASAAALDARAVAAARPVRVIVIGAGIVGASIAYHLARQGALVTILEKTRPGAGGHPRLVRMAQRL